MSRKALNLVTVEDRTAEPNEEILRIGSEAAEVIWKISQDFAYQEIEKIKKHYIAQEVKLNEQKQEAINKIAALEKELQSAKATIENLVRANKSLQVDVERETGELKSARNIVVSLQEKITKQEHEAHVLIEEVGRSKENADHLQKKIYELQRTVEQDQETLRQAQEEALVNAKMRERLDVLVRESKSELEQAIKQSRAELSRAVTAETAVTELRETVKKMEIEVRQLRDEKQELRSQRDAEVKNRNEAEKKIAAITARADTQEWALKDNVSKLEQELSVAKQESQGMRERLIKAESSVERERKARENLENKLIAATGVARL